MPLLKGFFLSLDLLKINCFYIPILLCKIVMPFMKEKKERKKEKTRQREGGREGKRERERRGNNKSEKDTEYCAHFSEQSLCPCCPG